MRRHATWQAATLSRRATAPPGASGLSGRYRSAVHGAASVLADEPCSAAALTIDEAYLNGFDERRATPASCDGERGAELPLRTFSFP
ncbi:hypothetical protein WMF18_24350 [Sorangium sp. So ce315]|uniref:hypothetical protein n=1 Tax=Sorangium sp. So ce315 TaxID=3133299 RepID=UPI003F5EFE86